jgi:predicted metal-dependent phosphoesterase TrpH
VSGIERQHGKARLQLARPSDTRDHADGANAVDRGRDHAADGRFRKGNTAARGKGAKRAARSLVPAKGLRMYEDSLAQLGSEGGTLAALHVADSVRHHLDAAELSELARAAGLGTEAGAVLHARAQRSSELALRSSVAALETARLLKHPRSKVARTKTPVGFEAEEISK